SSASLSSDIWRLPVTGLVAHAAAKTAQAAMKRQVTLRIPTVVQPLYQQVGVMLCGQTPGLRPVPAFPTADRPVLETRLIASKAVVRLFGGDEVGSEDDRENCDRGREGPWKSCDRAVVSCTGEHRPPARNRIRKSKTDERQRRFRKNECRQQQRGLDNEMTGACRDQVSS